MKESQSKKQTKQTHHWNDDESEIWQFRHSSSVSHHHQGDTRPDMTTTATKLKPSSKDESWQAKFLSSLADLQHQNSTSFLVGVDIQKLRDHLFPGDISSPSQSSDNKAVGACAV